MRILKGQPKLELTLKVVKCRLCNRMAGIAHHILYEYEALDPTRQAIFGKPKTNPECYSE